MTPAYRTPAGYETSTREEIIGRVAWPSNPRVTVVG
jgi:hypothetical protein